nr:reverse transcriptase domain-containing protein [Tanacetum cinerariifolium]
MTNTRSSMTPEAIEDLVNRRVEEVLAAYEATRAANALEAENQSQNGSDDDNGNDGNRNGGDENVGNRNGRNRNLNEDNRGARHVARECRYQNFMKCQPLNFNGTKGVVRTIRFDATFAMSWRELMNLMAEVYCPRTEIQKMELEQWNLTVKNNDLAAYTQRFQELTMMCTKMVLQEEDRVEKFIGGLPDNIQGNVKENQEGTKSDQNRTKTRSVAKPGELKMTRVEVMRKHGYGYLREIEVLRADNDLYTFKECDFPRLCINDIEDMLILIFQNRLTNLSGDDVFDFVIALRMFTRIMVIQKRVEDLQSGVESYQKKINVTKPDTTRPDIRKRTHTLHIKTLKDSFMLTPNGETAEEKKDDAELWKKILMKMMTAKYCPRSKIKKLEIEIWNLKVKGTYVVSYTQRFQELAIMCGRMFPEEYDKKYHAVIVYDEKIVRVPFGNEILIVRGDESNNGHESRLNIISCTKTQKYLLKGCHVFLAHVTAKKAEDKSQEKRLEDVHIV